MTTSRRAFLATSLTAGAVAAAGLAARRAAADEPKPDPKAAGGKPGAKTVLVLGGTGFLGPQIVDACLAKGWTVTLFNRGKTEERRGGMYPDLEKLRGDRDPKKGEGLKSLEGDRTWDVVFDTSGYFPKHVGASAQLLAPRVGQYVFVSSISAYREGAPPNSDETYPLATLEDPDVETMGPRGEFYGGLKVLCEKAVQDAMGARGKVATIVRPGFIVGAGDPTGRFAYWPARMDKGGEVLCPGTPEDPLQIIDARDLGEFLVKLAADGTGGAFNACGPANKEQKAGVILEACNKAAGKNATLTWVPWEFVEADEAQVVAPLLLPPKGETAGFHMWSNAKAVGAGLKYRPVEETCRATLEWFRALPEEKRNKQPMALEAEAALLNRWRERQTEKG